MSKTNNNAKVYLNSKGEQVMRVTEVLKVLAKEQLITWANMLGLKGVSYKAELERTANIGTMVHAFIEDYTSANAIACVDYDKYDIKEYGDRLEVTRAINSFLGWYEKVKDRYHIKFTEKVIVGEKLGGTIDCGIDGFEDPDKVIFVDYKTSKDFYLSQFLQLSGYVWIYEELHGEDSVEGVMVVLANKDGKPGRAKFIRRKNLTPVLTCFQCLFNTATANRILNRCWWKLTEEIS